MQPIFIFSLPRSGSTLLQRILATDPSISTASEPSLLLPYVYALRRNGIYAEFRHDLVQAAIEDFCQLLPKGEADYWTELREFVLNLYRKAAEEEHRYFLDKTPRYHLIVRELIELFPEGKFIFLWRNPLAIVASIMSTWAKGNWNLYAFNVDLYKGLPNLVHAFQDYSDRAFAVRFEDLVCAPGSTLPALFTYIDLDYTDRVLDNFHNIQLKGRMGDPTGIKQYSSINNAPLVKWKAILSNPVRRRWAARYLKWIGADRLSTIGYDLDRLLTQVNENNVSFDHLFHDIFLIPYGWCYNLVEPRIALHKFRQFRSHHYLQIHT